MKSKKALIVALGLMACAVLGAEAAGKGEAKPKKAALPIFLNLLPGLGIGSFVEGDPLGGGICLAGDLVGGGMAIGGLAYSFAAAVAAGVGAAMGQVLTLGYGTADTSGADPEIKKGMTVACIGCGVWAASKVFGIIRPITFANRYNREHGLSQMSLVPTLSPCFDTGIIAYEPGIAFKLSY
jgi:hypothetical protein